MSLALRGYMKLFLNPRMAVITVLGFSSGLPLPLTSGTLQAWLTVAGIDIRTIGIFSLVGLPYTLKFLWSPFMDRYVPPWLGRRRGWMLLCQALLVAGVAFMGTLDPAGGMGIIAGAALIVAFLSASQDIAVDAYRTDLLSEKERGVGVALSVFGYRIAMLVGGALALILSDRIGWQTTYYCMAGFMLLGMAGTLTGPEPDSRIIPPRSLEEAIWGPLKGFFSRPSAFIMLLLIILYKLGDAYAGTVTTAFLLRGAGFSPTDVGTINKGMGLVALLVGAMFGGTLMVRLGLFKSLMIFGILQTVSNLSFMVLAWLGKSYAMMIFAVAFENVAGGMGTAAFVALIMALCDKRYTATQFALLSSLSALGRVFIAPTSGYVVEGVGWALFFLITTFTALPGLWLLWWVRRDIEGLQSVE